MSKYTVDKLMLKVGDVVLVTSKRKWFRKQYAHLGHVIESKGHAATIMFGDDEKRDWNYGITLEGDFEVIDNFPLPKKEKKKEPEPKITRTVRLYRGAVEMICVEKDTPEIVSGWTEVVRKGIILRNLVTNMLLHRDKDIAAALSRHSTLKDAASWVLNDEPFEIELRNISL